MKAKTASIVLASALATAGQAPAEDLLTYVKISTHGPALEPGTDQQIEVDIDSAIDVRWRLEELFTAVAQREGMATSSPLLVRLKSLSTGVSAFLIAQERLLDFRNKGRALAAAIGKPEESAAREALQRASNDFSNAGLKAIDGIKPSDPELYSALNAAFGKGGDYADVAQVLQEFLKRASDDLAGRLTADHALQVLMTATLVDSSGRATALHLDGYDSISTGDPVPFARFQMQLDQRTQQEFAAAEALAPVVKDALNGKLGDTLKASLAELEVSIRTVPDQLKSSALAASLEALATKLVATGKTQLQPLADDVRQLKALLTSLSQPIALANGDPGDPSGLITIAGRISDAVKVIQRIVDEAPRVQLLVTTATQQVQQSAPELVDSARATLTEVSTTLLTQSPHLSELIEQLRNIADALGLTRDVGREVDATSRHARDVKPGSSLDTSLDLLTVKGERHPGDTVTLSATVRRGTGTDAVTLLQGRQLIRVEKYGWYSETRGALLFVQPAGTLTRNISFQPAPAIGYYWHYGARNRPALNHELALGIGATLTILDFDDEHDMEVGVGMGVTLLHDLFWAGAGRNLQARKNYYYVGINPLALVGLLRR